MKDKTLHKLLADGKTAEQIGDLFEKERIVRKAISDKQKELWSADDAWASANQYWIGIKKRIEDNIRTLQNHSCPHLETTTEDIDEENWEVTCDWCGKLMDTESVQCNEKGEL